MTEAVIKGEIHTSNRDKAELRELTRQDFDSGFFEGVIDQFPSSKYHFVTVFFLFGRLIYRYMGDRKFGDLDKILDNMDESYNVDVETNDILGQMSRAKSWILFIASTIAGIILTVDFVFLPLQYYAYNILAQFSLIFTLLPISVVFFALSVFEALPFRDKKMTANIVELTEDNNYERVMINCGNMHAPGIYHLLDKHGWNVRFEGSTWKFHFFRVFSGLLKVLFSPLKSYRTYYQ